MAALGSIVRALLAAAALALVFVGGVGFVVSRTAGDPRLRAVHREAREVATRVGLPRALLAPPLPAVLLGAGGSLALGALVLTRRSRAHRARVPADPLAARERAQPLDRRQARKLERRALALARKGHVREAAELCVEGGLLDRAAELLERAGELVRAAEIRHDQKRFEDAVELHQRAGDPEGAGAILAAQGEHRRAAECYVAAGRASVAAELFETAGELRRAAECYASAGFHREAAQAYIRCQAWREAAEALEGVILEERTRPGSGQTPAQQRELQKLALQAGKLYEQAGLLDQAEAVLEQGGCFVAAGEIALRRGRLARASELLLAGNQPVRAAEALQRLGDAQAASRILGEYHRSRGEDAEAAAHLEHAGEHLAAGDAYRHLEDFARAGAAYERAGDPLQAADMFRLAGDAERAALSFEKAGRWDDAAACWEEAGEPRRQAHALVEAGRWLAAGELYRREGLEGEAIQVLQRIAPTNPDAAAASALLGAIFEQRGELTLAVKKLQQAIGSTELARDHLGLFFTLARVHEAQGELVEAIDLYEKILSCDYHFEDVEERLRAAKARLATAGTPRGDTGLPTVPGCPAGRYQVLAELGRGGMGIVYKARDTVLDRVVALKVLPDGLKENLQALRNFLREAKSAAQLNHPNIVTIYDAGEQEGRYYIAMEYVDGSTLKEIVRRRGAIAPGGVLHVLVQMCEALAYAHEKRVVHRDIKTANAMWTRDRKAKIMDFGLAKVMEEVRNHTTLVSGTPYYMSPEQTLGRSVDHRTDLYSLGVTVFELATGRLPFTDGNIPYHHVHTPAPDPREVNPAVPALIATIIGRCLRKDPGERYPSAREILAEVRSALGRSRSSPS
jgi:tetratricopeptide (TPR) repeat protein